MPIRIRAMSDADGPAVLAIYRAGMDEGNATFETTAPTWAQFIARQHRLVAVEDESVLGWVAVNAVSARAVYAGVVEHSVYVAPVARGRGVGRALLAALIDSTEAAGIWTIQSAIFPENEASLALHLAAAFRVVGRQERIGLDKRTGQWRDVVLVERRSPVVD